MPVLCDRAAIRAILHADREWSVYALGDLAPGFFEHCSWFGREGNDPAVVLLFGAFRPPVIFALGKPGAVATILEEVDPEPTLYLHVRPEIVPVLEDRYRIVELKTMWRMILDPPSYRPATVEETMRLGPADVDSVARLYADGDASREAPDFFFPSMLEEGVFFGIREGEDLVTVAGTHLVAQEEGVAAIGNIYTRRDRRGFGLGARVTSAVVSELLRLNVQTVALNADQQNVTAVRLYERLGFVKYCHFCEGLAQRSD